MADLENEHFIYVYWATRLVFWMFLAQTIHKRPYDQN